MAGAAAIDLNEPIEDRIQRSFFTVVGEVDDEGDSGWRQLVYGVEFSGGL